MEAFETATFAFFNLPVKFAVLLKSSLLFNYFSIVLSSVYKQTFIYSWVYKHLINCHR